MHGQPDFAAQEAENPASTRVRNQNREPRHVEVACRQPGSKPGVGAFKRQNSICSQRVRAVGVTAEVANYCYYSRAPPMLLASPPCAGRARGRADSGGANI
jgi:hypothetical protein